MDSQTNAVELADKELSTEKVVDVGACDEQSYATCLKFARKSCNSLKISYLAYRLKEFVLPQTDDLNSSQARMRFYKGLLLQSLDFIHCHWVQLEDFCQLHISKF